MTGTASASAPVGPGAGGFRHEALFCAASDVLVASVAQFVADGVAEGKPVLVALRPATTDAVRRRLGPQADGVSFVDLEVLGPNPARLIPLWQDFLDHHPGAAHVRGVAEPAATEADPDLLVEFQRHEELLNLALRGRPLWLRCPYDTSILAPAVLSEARCSHPFVTEEGVPRENGHYRPPTDADAGAGPPLAPPPASAAALAVGPADLAAVRRFVDDRGGRAGLDAARRGDLVLAANELATNSIRHGGGGAELRLWDDGRDLFCQLEDAGHLEDPLAGRLRPGPTEDNGRGLWIANHLCDLVQLRQRPDGLVVRLRMRLPTSA